MEMIENQIGINLSSPPPPLPVATRSKRMIVGGEKKKHPIHAGAWDNTKGTWKTTQTEYTKLDCNVYKTINARLISLVTSSSALQAVLL